MIVKQTRNDKGQIGIGILIIFIALVLVATVGASILINTALTTEERAQQTGQESIQQVSDRLDVIDKLGETDSTGEVDVVRTQVGISAGADQVDLTEAQVSFVSDTDTVLTYGGENPDANEFGVNVLSDQSGTLTGDRPVISARGDVAEIEIALGETFNKSVSETKDGVDLSSTTATISLDQTPIVDDTDKITVTNVSDGSDITVNSVDDPSTGNITLDTSSVSGTDAEIKIDYEVVREGPKQLQERDEVDLTLRTGAGAESNAILRTPSPLRINDTFTFE